MLETINPSCMMCYPKVLFAVESIGQTVVLNEGKNPELTFTLIIYYSLCTNLEWSRLLDLVF